MSAHLSCDHDNLPFVSLSFTFLFFEFLFFTFYFPQQSDYGSIICYFYYYFLLCFNLQLIVITIISAHVTECKLTRRNHGLKKATTHLKPTKNPKTIIDAFNGLPAEDIEFIKQLDKQFNKFGGNVQIKVQKENRTTGKNTKRTIDGSLG